MLWILCPTICKMLKIDQTERDLAVDDEFQDCQSQNQKSKKTSVTDHYFSSNIHP